MRIILLVLIFNIYNVIYSQNFVGIQKIVASDRASGDQFGGDVAIDNDYCVIGAYIESEDTNGLNTLNFAGSAYIFEKNSNGTWFQKQKLVPTDRNTDDYFAAAVSIDSHRVAIGAYEKNVGPYTHAGAVYVFERDINGIWQQIAKLVAPDTSTKVHFGVSVAINGDYIIVGAPLEDKDTLASNPISDAGAAYIYKRDTNNNWSFLQKIIAADRGLSDFFGLPVDIYGDYAIAGAYREDEDSLGQNTLSDAGAVYVFKKNVNDIWVQHQKLVAYDRNVLDRFGTALSIYGNNIVVGCFLEDEDANGTNTMNSAGSAYIFSKNVSGYWVHKQKIVASDRSANDYFAISLAINKNKIIVGAEQESEDAQGNNTVSLAGSAYIFEENSLGVWQQKQKVVASDRGVIDLFGHSVDVSDSSIVVSAYAEDEDENGNNSLNGAGSAYMFEWCTASYSLINDSACYSYSSPSGNYVWNTSGTYNDTISNIRGCDSILTIQLTILSVDTSVTVTGSLFSSNQSGASYQWVDCNNSYSIIPGATNQLYSATTNGNYAVIINSGGCIDTSGCHSVTSVDISFLEKNNFYVFPNPCSGECAIQFDNLPYKIEITDIRGMVVLQKNVNKSVDFIDTNNFSPGIYIVRVASHNEVFAQKLVIKK